MAIEKNCIPGWLARIRRLPDAQCQFRTSSRTKISKSRPDCKFFGYKVAKSLANCIRNDLHPKDSGLESQKYFFRHRMCRTDQNGALGPSQTPTEQAKCKEFSKIKGTEPKLGRQRNVSTTSESKPMPKTRILRRNGEFLANLRFVCTLPDCRFLDKYREFFQLQ